MKYLLDTNVVVDYLRGDTLVVGWIDEHLERGFGISTISLAELFHGAEKSNHPRKNISRIERFISIPEVEVLDVDKLVAREYGKLLGELERAGTKLGILDVMIAATGKLYQLIVLTNDKKCFPRLKKFGVKVEIV